MASEAEIFWKDWIEGERSVAALRLHIIPLLEQMRLASQRQDWEAFQRLFEAYSFVAEQCKDEPLLTTFEWGLMVINLEIADGLSVHGDLERAMEHIDHVSDTLRISDQRRAEHGMSERPNSEIRFTCVGFRCQCLLENGDLFEDRPDLEVTLMASEFWHAAENAVAYLQANRSEDEDHVRLVMHVLSRFELELCKLSWRHNQAFARLALEKFNARIGNQLELSLRHFTQLDPLENRSGWYWDFELSKLETAGNYTREEVLHCARQRSLGARLSFGSGPLPLLEQLWSRQVRRLLDNLEAND